MTNTNDNAERNNAQVQNKTQEQDIGQLLKIRREKLAALREEGRDPFTITKYDVSQYSEDIKSDFENLDGQTVSCRQGRMMSKQHNG